MSRLARGAALVLGLLVLVLPGRSVSANSFALALFEQYLESLRQQARIPGLSAAIVQDEDIVWETGLGLQDVEKSIRATPATPYLVGDMTQTLSSVVLLRLVERGRLGLDSEIGRFTRAIPERDASVGHVLAHTSEGTPGSAFKYDPQRFASLTEVIESTTGVPFSKAISTTVLDSLAMRDSVPGRILIDGSNSSSAFDAETLSRYDSVLQRMASSYRVDASGRLVRSEHDPEQISAASGLVSTVRDLARFDAALNRAARDDEFLLQQRTLLLSWTNMTTADGTPTPAGLGWFVQNYDGERIVWHFGLVPDAYSSLIIKLPARNLTLILLANSDGLSAPYHLEQGDVTASFFARLFLRIFG